MAFWRHLILPPLILQNKHCGGQADKWKKVIKGTPWHRKVNKGQQADVSPTQHQELCLYIHTCNGSSPAVFGLCWNHKLQQFLVDTPATTQALGQNIISWEHRLSHLCKKTRVPVVLGSTCFPCLYLIITLTVLYIICSRIISSCFYCVGQWPHFLVSLRN